MLHKVRYKMGRDEGNEGFESFERLVLCLQEESPLETRKIIYNNEVIKIAL